MRYRYNKANDPSYTVKEPMELYTCLTKMMPGKSRTSLKALLSNKMVQVNEKIISQYNFLLHAEDFVVISSRKGPNILKGIQIIYEDDEIIAIDKKSGILSVPTPTEKRNTAHTVLTEYVQRTDKHQKIYIVHRLDHYTSGVMIFVKNEKLQLALRNNWAEQVEERIYIAVIEGQPEKKVDKIISWLKENKTFEMYSSEDKTEGKKAITHYKIIKSTGNYSLAEVSIDTGRKNQIRVHFNDMEHPVAGDRKYGAKTDPCGRLMLHAKTLKFKHPFTGKEYKFTSEVPKNFVKLFEKR